MAWRRWARILAFVTGMVGCAETNIWPPKIASFYDACVNILT
jgi:hypothetical protein